MKNSDTIFWPEDEVNQSLKQSMDKNYTDCINILQTQWYQADLDQRFAMGDQDLWGLLFPGVASSRRKIFNFNLINAHLQMISGYQRRNRKSTVSIPVQTRMQKTSDQLTKCLYNVHNQTGAYQIYSDAFEQGALTQGLGFVSIYKDTSDDPISGSIKLRYIDMKSCLFDPFFRKHDMSDCRFFRTRQFFEKKEAALLYPQFEDQIMNLPGGAYRDDKFHYMPEVYQIQFPNMIAMDEYWYLSSREAIYIIDVDTNETQEYTGEESDLSSIKKMFKGRLKVIKKPKMTVRRSIILNDKVMVDEPNPYGLDRYPIVPFLGYFNPDTPYYAYKFRGVVRDLRDAQYLFNRRKVTDLDILESQQQGLKVKKGALVTPDDVFNQGNGRILSIDPKFQMSDVEPMQIIPPSPTMIQMEEMLEGVMSKISGVSPEMMGHDIDDKAGIITMMRNAAGTTTLTKLFDQFDESQRLCGDIIVEMIQKNWTYGKVMQVIGEEPTPEFDNKLFFKYGCKVIQGVMTESQQQMELAQLLHLNEIMAQNPPQPVLKRIIDAMYIQNKQELKDDLNEFQKAQNEQQSKKMELELRNMEIENATKIGFAKAQEAKSISDQALAQERLAKIETDKAVNIERINRSQEEKTASILNLIKAAKELQGMDIENVAREIELLGTLQAQSQQQMQPMEAALLTTP